MFIFNLISFSFICLRVASSSQSSSQLTSSPSTDPLDIPGHIPLDIPGHTIPLDPGHTNIPLDIPLIFRLHRGEWFGEPIRFSQTAEGELLATIFETFSNAS